MRCTFCSSGSVAKHTQAPTFRGDTLQLNLVHLDGGHVRGRLGAARLEACASQQPDNGDKEQAGGRDEHEEGRVPVPLVVNVQLDGGGK